MVTKPDLPEMPLPDLFANTPQVASDLGNNMWKGVGQGIQALMDGIIERVGELGGAAMMATAGKTLDVAAGATNVVAGAAAAPFEPGFVPSAGPERAAAPDTPSRGKSREMEVSHSNEADLGQLTPTPIQVARNVEVNQGIGR